MKCNFFWEEEKMQKWFIKTFYFLKFSAECNQLGDVSCLVWFLNYSIILAIASFSVLEGIPSFRILKNPGSKVQVKDGMIIILVLSKPKTQIAFAAVLW